MHRSRAKRTLLTTLALVLAFAWAFPVYWMLNSAFLPNVVLQSATPTFLPFGGSLDNLRAVATEHGIDGITEERMSAAMYQPTLRDPDVIIRTAGEQRTSNFLVWQSAYSELVFTDVLWPDFDLAALTSTLAEFASRERRFGGRA